MFLAQTMAIRRLKDDRLLSNGGRFDKRVDSVATVSTLPTVKAMRDCFEGSVAKIWNHHVVVFSY
jgi:hypothetical protein